MFVHRLLSGKTALTLTEAEVEVKADGWASEKSRGDIFCLLRTHRVQTSPVNYQL